MFIVKMRFILLSVVGLAALACASPAAFQEPNAFNYHESVGIKEAERIRKSEIEILTAGGLRKNERIVGGVVAPIDAHPYLVGLIIDIVGLPGNSVCGGSLITASRVLTAAHCWFDGVNQAWRFTVVLGSQYLFFGGGIRIQTTDIIVHPNWTTSTIAQDVAVVYLNTNVQFSNQVYPIALPTGTAIWEDFNGNWAIAAGYGRTNDQTGLTTSTLVSHVNIQVIANWQCQASFGAIVLASNICTNGAGGVGICGGDSGGPLIVIRNGQPVVIGISSFVARAGCQLGHPSVFARVTSFLDFVYQNL